MAFRLLTSIRPAIRPALLASSPRLIARAVPVARPVRAFPALVSHLRQSAEFHTYLPTLQAAEQEEPLNETESSLPTRFDEIKALHPDTAKAIKKVFKYETMSKVQSEVLSLLPTETDMFVKAKTGTGKTLAFLIPALETVVAKTDKKTLSRGDLATCLVVSPTRELAQQIAEEARKLASTHKFNVHCLVGGENKRIQLRSLNNKRVDIIVGTPGRLNDLIESVSEFRRQLTGVKTLILDECDQLLDMGFKDSVESIVEALPADRQTLFFSATVSREIKSIARTSLRPDFTFIDTVDPNEANTNLQVDQSYCVVPYDQQVAALSHIIDEHKAKNPDGKIMVFLPTTRGTQLYASLFEELTRYKLFSLHSKKSQEQRTKTSDRFRKSRGTIMFTSDVSARGVDYPDVSLVIQVGIPSSKEQYIHRVGRTGRAGKTGEGMLILSPLEKAFVGELSDLPMIHSDIKEKLATASEDESFQKRLIAAKEALDLDMVHDAFTAYLGYYTGRVDLLRCRKPDILDSAKEYIVGLGAEEPPHLSESFLAKLGLHGRGPQRGGSRGRDSFRRDSHGRGRSAPRFGGDRDDFNRRDDNGRGRDSDRSFGRNQSSSGSRNFGRSQSSSGSRNFGRERDGGFSRGDRQRDM